MITGKGKKILKETLTQAIHRMEFEITLEVLTILEEAELINRDSTRTSAEIRKSEKDIDTIAREIKNMIHKVAKKV